jgi:hypothetical protein
MVTTTEPEVKCLDCDTFASDVHELEEVMLDAIANVMKAKRERAAREAYDQEVDKLCTLLEQNFNRYGMIPYQVKAVREAYQKISSQCP